MVKDGEDLTRITNDEIEKFRPNFPRCANRHVAPLSLLKGILDFFEGF